MKSSFWDLHWPLVLFEPRFPQLSQWTGLCSVPSLRGAPMPLDRTPGPADTVTKPGTDPSSWALSLLLAPPCRAGPSRVLPIVLSLSSALDWCRAERASGGSLARQAGVDWAGRKPQAAMGTVLYTEQPAVWLRGLHPTCCRAAGSARRIFPLLLFAHEKQTHGAAREQAVRKSAGSSLQLPSPHRPHPLPWGLQGQRWTGAQAGLTLPAHWAWEARAPALNLSLDLTSGTWATSRHRIATRLYSVFTLP